jgi:hypothetical protein
MKKSYGWINGFFWSVPGNRRLRQITGMGKMGKSPEVAITVPLFFPFRPGFIRSAGMLLTRLHSAGFPFSAASGSEANGIYRKKY